MISLFEKATNTKLPEAVEAKITVDTRTYVDMNNEARLYCNRKSTYVYRTQAVGKYHS